jgi:ABC-type antimicrobial peptide transport system permease subunit
MLYYALKELQKRRKWYLLNVLVIGLVTALIVIINALGIAYKDASRLPFEDVQSTIIIQRNGNVPDNMTGILLSCSLAPIHQEIADEINKMSGVKDISSALFLWVFDQDHFKRVLGVNWNDKFGKNVSLKLVEGSIPRTDQEILIEKTYAQKYGLKTGQEIEISNHPYRISGIINTTGNEIVASDIYLTLNEAQERALESSNLQKTEPFSKTDVNIIFVDSGQSQIATLAQAIKHLLAGDSTGSGQTPLGQAVGSYNIYTPESFATQISSFFRISDRLIWIISLIILIAGALIIARSMLHIILERKREFAIMKSVGFRGSDIQKKIFIETSIQLLGGFIAGLILSAIVITALAHTKVSIAIPWELTAYPHFLLSNPNEANEAQSYFLPIKFEPAYLGISFIVIVVIGITTSFLSIRQINSIKPMEVMRNE